MEALSVVGKEIFIVGGGNSAGQAAMFFSSYAASVTVLVRGEGLVLTMSQYLIAQLNQRHNITVEAYTQVVSADGEHCLEALSTTPTDPLPPKRTPPALLVIIAAIPTTHLPPPTPPPC